MKNDYTKNTFWQEKDDNGNTIFFIKLNDVKVEVSKEVFYAMFNSYRRSLREDKRQCMSLDMINFHELIGKDTQPLDDIYNEYVTNIVHIAISQLGVEEYKIIVDVFYKNMSEAEIGKELNISRHLVHYRKVKILKQRKRQIEPIYKSKNKYETI